jgi:hypothetical protein
MERRRPALPLRCHGSSADKQLDVVSYQQVHRSLSAIVSLPDSFRLPFVPLFSSVSLSTHFFYFCRPYLYIPGVSLLPSRKTILQTVQITFEYTAPANQTATATVSHRLVIGFLSECQLLDTKIPMARRGAIRFTQRKPLRLPCLHVDHESVVRV